MIPSLTGSLTGTKLESLYEDVGQDDLFIFSYYIFSAHTKSFQFSCVLVCSRSVLSVLLVMLSTLVILNRHVFSYTEAEIVSHEQKRSHYEI